MGKPWTWAKVAHSWTGDIRQVRSIAASGRLPRAAAVTRRGRLCRGVVCKIECTLELFLCCLMVATAYGTIQLLARVALAMR